MGAVGSMLLDMQVSVSPLVFASCLLVNRLPSDTSDSTSSYPRYESYPPWLLQLLSLDQDTRMQLLARLPKRDSPGLATRQAGERRDSLSEDRKEEPRAGGQQCSDPLSSSWTILARLLLLVHHLQPT